MASTLSPGFGWTSPPASRVVLHPESIVVDSGNFPSNLPGELLSKVLGETNLSSAELATSIETALISYFRKSNELSEELNEFRRTGKSNDRPMKWHVMRIAPNTSFRLHAHQNIELIYVARGTMHELRFNGMPPKRLFPVEEKDGPDLSCLDKDPLFVHRSTTAATTNIQERFLINEKGSIHLSYTMEDGADLLVLWSGGHGNIPVEQYPRNAAEVLVLPPSVTPF